MFGSGYENCPEFVVDYDCINVLFIVNVYDVIKVASDFRYVGSFCRVLRVSYSFMCNIWAMGILSKFRFSL